MITEEDIPNTSTGPATVNIFAPTPIIYPSDLYSIDGATIEFANPVIGIKEPAPANLPILLKTFMDVKIAESPIRQMETIVLDEVWSNPLDEQQKNIIWPIEQINPPTQNALKQFLKVGELGDFFFT